MFEEALRQTVPHLLPDGIADVLGAIEAVHRCGYGNDVSLYCEVTGCDRALAEERFREALRMGLVSLSRRSGLVLTGQGKACLDRLTADRFAGPAGDKSPESPAGRDYQRFEVRARRVISLHYSTSLPPGRMPNVDKLFDFVSHDLTVVGDAKFFTMVRGVGLPPAKFSVIAEHVWLLEKTQAKHQFLVFGNDRRVPARWLEKYGRLLGSVKFFFLEENDTLMQMT